MRYEVEVNGRVRQVNVHRADGHFVVSVDGREWTVDAARVDGHTLSLLVGSSSQEITMAPDAAAGQLAVAIKGVPLSVTVNGRRRWGRQRRRRRRRGPQQLIAPMPGKIVRVLAKVGRACNHAPAAGGGRGDEDGKRAAGGPTGVVSELLVQEGQSVDAGALLLIVTPE